MLKSFEDIKNNIRDIYYQINCAIENDIINTPYPITIWLSDDYYCIYIIIHMIISYLMDLK